MGKNKGEVRLRGRDIVNRKILLLGETGSGKTSLLAKLIQELMTFVDPEKMTVIDLAPQRINEIGGKLTDYLNMPNDVDYSSPETVYTPRLVGTSPKQVLRYAELNRKNMEPLLDRFAHNSTDILIVNDVTLYLHAGKLETVLKCVKLAKTFLATAYYGSKLAEDLGTRISSRERELTDQLASFMDLVVKIDSSRKTESIHAFSSSKPEQSWFRLCSD